MNERFEEVKRKRLLWKQNLLILQNKARSEMQCREINNEWSSDSDTTVPVKRKRDPENYHRNKHFSEYVQIDGENHNSSFSESSSQKDAVQKLRPRKRDIRGCQRTETTFNDQLKSRNFQEIEDSAQGTVHVDRPR